MTDAIIGIPDVTTATTKAAPKPQQTATITMTAPDGATLQLVAERKAEGAKTYVMTMDATKKTQRGMTEDHASFDAAKKATEKMATQAAKLGWKRKEARRGFVPKPDAFTALPAPPTAPKAKK
jgi:hypothetical protein